MAVYLIESNNFEDYDYGKLKEETSKERSDYASLGPYPIEIDGREIGPLIYVDKDNSKAVVTVSGCIFGGISVGFNNNPRVPKKDRIHLPAGVYKTNDFNDALRVANEIIKYTELEPYECFKALYLDKKVPGLTFYVNDYVWDGTQGAVPASKLAKSRKSKKTSLKTSLYDYFHKEFPDFEAEPEYKMPDNSYGIISYVPDEDEFDEYPWVYVVTGTPEDDRPHEPDAITIIKIASPAYYGNVDYIEGKTVFSKDFDSNDPKELKAAIKYLKSLIEV